MRFSLHIYKRTRVIGMKDEDMWTKTHNANNDYIVGGLIIISILFLRQHWGRRLDRYFDPIAYDSLPAFISWETKIFCMPQVYVIVWKLSFQLQRSLFGQIQCLSSSKDPFSNKFKKLSQNVFPTPKIRSRTTN